MTGFSDRAEQIAAYLVAHETGAKAIPHDVEGRQAAVDFHLDWPDGKRSALEVTLITEPTTIAWQGMAAKDGWRWPAETSWEFRAANDNFPYKRTRQVVTRIVQLCDEWLVDRPEDLPADSLTTEPEILWFLADDTGTLQRTVFSPGVVLYQSTRAEFLDSSPSDFSLIVESWHDHPHLASHIEKVKKAVEVSDRHLFLVPLDDALPARYFTSDFETPKLLPQGFEGIDVLWVWSNYWHRYLMFRDQTWRWIDFPAASDN